MKTIDGGAPDLHAGWIDEAGNLLDDVVGPAELLGPLSGQQLDLPAAQIARPADEGRRPRRPAILDASRRQLRRTSDPRVDDHPPLVEPQILQWNVEMLAHEAVGAIAAEQRAGCRTRSSPCMRSRAVRATPRSSCVKATARWPRNTSTAALSATPSRSSRSISGCTKVLVGGQARGYGGGCGSNFLIALSVDAEKVRPGMRGGELRDPLRQPAGLEDPHHLVVESDRRAACRRSRARPRPRRCAARAAPADWPAWRRPARSRR